MINKYIINAYSILDDKDSITRDLIIKLSEIKGHDVLDLISLANKVKAKYSKNKHICTIMNAKSGECSQDCKYCAQSIHHNSEIPSFPLAGKEEILDAAEITFKNGVGHFGIVTSGYGFKEINNEFRIILESIDLIKEKIPHLNICASLGILNEECVAALAERKIVHYNINIQVNSSNYKKFVATTHLIEERINTIKLLKKYGINVCCGGIIGGSLSRSYPAPESP